GGTLVSEIGGSWIDDIGPDGRLRWAVRAPVSYPSDPQQLAPNRFLLADYAPPGAALIMNRSGRAIWKYGPGTGPGELDPPSTAGAPTRSASHPSGRRLRSSPRLCCTRICPDGSSSGRRRARSPSYAGWCRD